MKVRILLAMAMATVGLNAAPDTIDSTFQTNAGTYFDADSFGGIASSVVQPDGKVIFGSNEMPALGHTVQLSLTRFNPDGTLDDDFDADNDPNGDGNGILYVGAGWPEVHAVDLQSDGKIIAAGVMNGFKNASMGAPEYCSSILRFNADGSYDPTFAAYGTSSGPVGGFNFIEELAIQPDDKIICVGGFGGFRDKSPSTIFTRYGIARLNADGSLDQGFQINPSEFGVPPGAANPRGFFRQAAVDASGDIYVIGTLEWGPSFPNNEETSVFARLNPDGSRDLAFNPSLPADLTFHTGIVLEPSGDITFLGERDSGSSYMARFTSSGSVAGGFNLAGGLGLLDARPLRRDPNGKFLVSKRANTSQPRNTLIRLNNDGSVDPTFNATAAWVSDSNKSGYFSAFVTGDDGAIYSGSFFDRVEGEVFHKIVKFEGDYIPSSPGTIQMGSFALSVNEEDGTLLVPVTRTGGTTGVASVTYSFADINAANGTDYTGTSGTVTFAAGIGGTKYITVPIATDALVESPEVFTVNLGTAMGATLGTQTSTNVVIVDSNSPPQIIAQPQPIYVPPFDSFVLSVGVLSGANPVTYQWKKNGVDIPGATSPLYLVTNADPGLHNGDYTVVVTNPNGSVTSNVATVVVKDPAQLGFSASTVSVIENAGSVTLTLTRGGSSVGAVSAQVTPVENSASDSDFGNTPVTVNWADGDSATKTVTVPIIDDGDAEPQETFTAILTNFSPDAIPANPSSLLITILDDDSPLTIATQPSSQTLQEDEALTLTVAADSQTPLTYQWFLDGDLIPGETSATLTIDPVTLSGAGSYTVEITNAAGTVPSDAAVVIVKPAPYLTTTPPPTPDLDQGVYAIALIDNQTAWVSGSSSTLGYILQKVSLDPAVPVVTITMNSQADELALLPGGGVAARGFFSTVNGQSQSYLAKFNADGTLATGQITSGITTRPTAIATDSSGRLLVGGGGGVVRRYSTNGTQDSAFPQVSFGSNPVIDAIAVEGSAIYVGGRFTSSGVGTAGNYLTKLNDDGTRDASFNNTQNLRPVAIRVMDDGKVATLAQPSIGTVSQWLRIFDTAGNLDSSPASLGSLSYFDFAFDDNGTIYSPRANTPYLAVSNGDPNFITNMGAFNQSVSAIEVDQAGRVWIGGFFSTLNGNPVPRLVILNGSPGELAIIEQPELVAAEVGDSATFSVSAISSGTLAYQWRKNGVDLPGETGSSLTLASVSPGDADFYDVVVTNTDTALSLPSEPAELIVLGAPEVRESPASVTLIVGEDLTLESVFYASSPFTLQWKKNGSDLPGATGATYEISSGQLTDSGSYTLTITNGQGNATTVAANIQFIPDPAALADGFVPPTSIFGYPESINPTADGGAYFGGNFYSVTHPSGPLNSYLARVDGTGAPVGAFIPLTNGGSASRPSDTALDSTGKLVAVSTANSFYGMLVNGNYYEIVKFNEDGTNNEPFTTNANTALNGTFNLVALDSSDRVYVAKANSLVRLNADGTLDSGYTPTFTGTPVEIAIDSSGRLLVMTSNSLQRFATDGTLDSTFTLDASVPTTPLFVTFVIGLDGNIHIGASNGSSLAIHRLAPDGSLLESLTSLGLPASTAIRALAVQANGKYLIGHSATGNLSRVLADGTPDPLWDIGTGFNSNVEEIALTEDGKIWVSGGFNTFKGVTHRSYALLNGDPVDIIILQQPQNTFADIGTTAELSVQASGLGGAPITYQWLKDGSELPGETSATLTIANAQESDEGSYEVAITNTTTGRDRTSSAATLTVLAEPEILALSGTSYDLEVGDSLLLSVEAQGAGTLTYQWQKNGSDIPGATSTNYEIPSSEVENTGIYTVIVTNTLGNITSADIAVTVVFSPAAIAEANDPLLSVNGTVSTILPLPDGRTLIGGSFSTISYNGTSRSIDEIALINADGSLDTNFDLNPNSGILSLALDGQGRVILGGSFTSIGGQSRPRFARLNTDLTLDLTFASTAGPNNTVYDAQPAAGGGYYLAGIFGNFGGNTTYKYVARVDENGLLDEDFIPDANLNTSYRVMPLPNGQVIVGGAFSNGGLGYVARFNADGSHDTSYPVSSTNYVYDMVMQPDGKLIVGGRFGRLFRFNTDGTQDNTFAPSIGQDIWAIKVDKAGKILVGGAFTTFNSGTVNRIIRLNADGTTDTAFTVGTGANAQVEDIALKPLGGIWVGGSFTEYRGTTANRLVLLNGDPLDIAIVSHPSDTAVDPNSTATFTVSAAATDTILYQWQKNGVDLADGGDISGTTTATLSIANAEDSDEGDYQVIVTHSVTNEELTSNSAELVVLGAPEILTQPESLTVEAGLDAVFSVEARGASPVTYQWFKGGSPLSDDADISGATTSELTLTGLTVADSGTISVRVSNGLGTVDSLTVNLDVVRLPASIDRSIYQPTFNGTVLSLCPLEDGSVIVGGQFSTVTHATGSTSRRYLTKISPTGSVDLTYPQTSSGTYVNSIDRTADGKILIAGNFTALNVNGSIVTRNRVARINADGTLDTTFDPVSGPNGQVEVVRALPDGKVLIGGLFSSVNGVTTGTSRMARLNSDGSVDTGFVSQATSTVTDIALIDGDYWIATIGSYAGQSYNARVTPTGALVASNYNGFMNAYDLVPSGEGGVILSSESSWPYFEKLAGDGTRSTTWPNLQNGTGGPNNRVYELAAHGSTRTVVAGTFNAWSGSTMNNLAMINNADGSLVAGFDPGSGFSGNYPNVMKVDAEGRIWCGGFFTSYKGETVGRLVVLNGLPVQDEADPWEAYVASLPANQRGENDDPDGDGVSNLFEFAYGTLPGDGTSKERIVNGYNDESGATINTIDPSAGVNPARFYFTITYRFPDDPQGVTLTPQATLNLPDFEDGSAQLVPFGDPIDDGDFYLQRYYLTPDRNTQASAFTRLQATRP